MSAERCSICKSRLRLKARSMHSRKVRERWWAGKFVGWPVAMIVPLSASANRSRTGICPQFALRRDTGQTAIDIAGRRPASYRSLKSRLPVVMRALFFLLLIAPLGALAAERLLLVEPALYSGMADASGAVPVSSNLFVAASDEDNILRLYP